MNRQRLNDYVISGKEYSGSELIEMLKKYCADPQEPFDSLQEKTNALIEKYTNRVKENDTLSADERRVWLGNNEIMRDYYLELK